MTPNHDDPVREAVVDTADRRPLVSAILVLVRQWLPIQVDFERSGLWAATAKKV